MKHLSNLAAKIAARKALRAKRKPGQGSANGDTFSVALTYVRPTRAMRQKAHKAKMCARRVYGPDSPARVGLPASINRRTGKPHEHRREIERRLATLEAGRAQGEGL